MTKKRFIPNAAPVQDDDEPRNDSIMAMDEAIYGKVALPESGRVVARPIALGEISPDPKQPRRAVPLAVRMVQQYTGDINTMLNTWYRMAAKLAGRNIDFATILKGMGDGSEEEKAGEPLFDEFVDLVGLAASIHRDGLANPITVSGAGPYMVETGERRWLAYHLLRQYVDQDKYAVIPARVVDRGDVWRQAAENGARRPLNAIGMARQLALLIMDMYAGDDGVSFAPYEKLVLAGGNDRPFYAQVANGNVWRIKKNAGERMLQVTGLKSMEQIRQYRALLNISDEMWIQADVESWTEGKIRLTLNPPKEDTVTTVTVSDGEDDETSDAIEPHYPDGTPIRVGDKVRLIVGTPEEKALIWTVRDLGDGRADIETWHLGKQRTRAAGMLTLMRTEDKPVSTNPFAAGFKPAQAPAPLVKTDSAYDGQPREVNGHLYKIGEMVLIPTAKGGWEHGAIMRFSGDMFVVSIAQDGDRRYSVTIAGSLVKPIVKGEAAAVEAAADTPAEMDTATWAGVTFRIGDMVRSVGNRARVGIIRRFEERKGGIVVHWDAPSDKNPGGVYPAISPIGIMELATGDEPPAPVVLDDEDDDDDDSAFDYELPERQVEMLLAIHRNEFITNRNAATRMALEEKGMIEVVNREEWLMTVTADGRAYLKNAGLLVTETLESDRPYFYDHAEFADVRSFITMVMELALKANDTALHAECNRILNMAPRGVAAVVREQGTDAMAAYLNTQDTSIKALLDAFINRWVAFGQMVMTDANRIAS